MISTKSIDTDSTIPTAYTSQLPSFATSTSMCLTKYIQGVSSPPQNSQPLSNLPYDISLGDPLSSPLSTPSPPPSGFYPILPGKSIFEKPPGEHTSSPQD